MFDVENYNELQIDRVKAMYLDCLDLLKRKLHESGQYKETEEYRRLKFDLVKLGLSSICAIKKCSQQNRKLEDSVAIYFEKRFHLFEARIEEHYGKKAKSLFASKSPHTVVTAYVNQFLYKFKIPSMA